MTNILVGPISHMRRNGVDGVEIEYTPNHWVSISLTSDSRRELTLVYCNQPARFDSGLAPCLPPCASYEPSAPRPASFGSHPP